MDEIPKSKIKYILRRVSLFFKSMPVRLRKSFKEIDRIHRQKAIEDLDWEMQELKHVFALLTIGSFIGIPAAPLPVTLELLPDMQQEFAIMLVKIRTAHSPLSEQFSKFDAV